MMNENGQHMAQSDELSLLDLIKMFIQHQKVFWIGFFSFFFVGMAFIIVKPKYMDITQQVNLPYTLTAEGSVFYPLSMQQNKTDSTFYINSPSDVTKSGALAFWQSYNHLKGLLKNNGFDLNLLATDGSTYDAKTSKLPVMQNQWQIVAKIKTSQVRQHLNRLQTVVDAWMQQANAKMQKKKQILAQTVASTKVNLSTAANTHQVTETSFHPNLAATPSWLNLSQQLHNQEVMLNYWHGFSINDAQVMAVPQNVALSVTIAIFLALLAGVFLIVMANMRDVWQKSAKGISS